MGQVSAHAQGACYDARLMEGRMLARAPPSVRKAQMGQPSVSHASLMWWHARARARARVIYTTHLLRGTTDRRNTPKIAKTIPLLVEKKKTKMGLPKNSTLD